MERREWYYSKWSNRVVRALWILFGITYIFQGYTQWRLSNVAIGVVQILFGVSVCIVFPILVPRRNRIRIDDSGVRIPGGLLWTTHLPWEDLDRLRLHRMGVEFERRNGGTASIRFGEISYNMIQTLRPELHSYLKQIAESKGITLVEDG